MENNVLRIKYTMGVMVIYMDRFFPADPRSAKKLLRIVDMSYNPDQLCGQLCRYLRERIADAERELPKMAEEYVNLRTQYAEVSDRVKTHKAANGVPLTKDQYGVAVAAGRSLRGSVHDAETRIKRAKRSISSLRKNLEVIEDA